MPTTHELLEELDEIKNKIPDYIYLVIINRVEKIHWREQDTNNKKNYLVEKIRQLNRVRSNRVKEKIEQEIIYNFIGY